MKFAVRNALFAALAVSVAAIAQAPAQAPAKPQVKTVPGMPPVADAANLYSETAAGKMRPELANDLPRVYVPHIQSHDVYVIDPSTFTVVGKMKAGLNPQHVVPSWDLHTLWVTNNAEGRTDGSLTPIDPQTGKPGASIPVDDPYNMYFTPDGKAAILGTIQGGLRVLEMGAGGDLSVREGHRGTVNVLALAPDGHIRVSASCATSVPGIYAVGDVATPCGQLAIAVGQGAVAAEAIDRLIAQLDEPVADLLPAAPSRVETISISARA